MKYYRKLWSLLGLAVLLFYSCEQDGDFSRGDSENDVFHPFVSEARAYFEDYASMDLNFETMGLHPGLIAPQWEKAKAFSLPGLVSADIPLWTEAAYEGSFFVRDDSGVVSATDTYYTSILQKLIVVKSLEFDLLSCYIATVIPDMENATRNSSLIADMFCGGIPDANFSGVVVYSTVTTNYTIQVERYKHGELSEVVSLFGVVGDSSQEYEAMNRIVGARSIRRNVKAVTRNGEMGGGCIMLPEVVITAPKPGPTPPPPSLPPPPPPPFPTPPPVPNPPVTPPPGYGGGNYSGGGGTSSSKTPNVDKLYGKNSTLSAEDKAELEKAIAEIRKSSIFKEILDLFESKNIKFTFKIDNTILCSAQFNSVDGSITFSSSESISAGSLREELVHGLQYNVLYTSKEMGKYGFNIEWEAHIFVDVAITLHDGKYLRGNYNTLFGGTKQLKDMHRNLLNKILQEGRFTNKHVPLYKQASENWCQYEGRYVESFPPKGLFQYIKKTK